MNGWMDVRRRRRGIKNRSTSLQHLIWASSFPMLRCQFVLWGNCVSSSVQCKEIYILWGLPCIEDWKSSSFSFSSSVHWTKLVSLVKVFLKVYISGDLMNVCSLCGWVGWWFYRLVGYFDALIQCESSFPEFRRGEKDTQGRNTIENNGFPRVNWAFSKFLVFN